MGACLTCFYGWHIRKLTIEITAAGSVLRDTCTCTCRCGTVWNLRMTSVTPQKAHATRNARRAG